MNFYPITYSEIENSYQKIVREALVENFKYLTPYVVGSSLEINRIMGEGMLFGITATCQGFYHPQGRFLWTPNNKSILLTLKELKFENKVVTNFEMETSGILGLARYFGHQATSISLILANRVTNEFIENAEDKMRELVELCLDRVVSIE
jgi:uridine phosphorylase